MTIRDFPTVFRETDRIPFDLDVVNLYRKSGWKHLIPTPFGKQDPPPSGFSGRNGDCPDGDQLKAWIRASRQGAKTALESKGRIKRTERGIGPGPYNIAIVHGPDTISIDVDQYDIRNSKTGEMEHKNGGETLKELERQLGPLPSTWTSSARGLPGNYGSGQRFFRLKAEHRSDALSYRDKPGPYIEVVRYGHRYSVCWPSRNDRLGEIYQWWRELDQGWQVVPVPQHDELPYLPDSWVKFLTNDFTPYADKHKAKHNAGTFGKDKIEEWISDRARNNTHSDSLHNRGSLFVSEGSKESGTEGDICRKIQDTLDEAIEALPNGAHDALTRFLMQGMHLFHEGHSGIRKFLKELHDAFIDEVEGRRDGGRNTAETEWFRSFIGSLEYVTKRNDPAASSCTCYRGGERVADSGAAKQFSDIDGGGKSGGEDNGDKGKSNKYWLDGLPLLDSESVDNDPASYDQSDDGNAEHLIDIVGHRMKYVPVYRGWMIWDRDKNIWVEDNGATALKDASLVGRRLQDRAAFLFEYAKELRQADSGKEAEFIQKQASLMYKFGQQSRNVGRIRAMLELARARTGMVINGEDFDSDETLLVCNNGTLVLDPRRASDDSYGEGGPKLGVDLRPSKREDFNTRTTGIDYVPWTEIRIGGEADALVESRKVVEDYLDTFIPDHSLRGYVQRVFGYGLYGANPERKIVFLHGDTSTGKSTILSAVSSALGSYAGTFNLSLLRDKQDEGPRAELVHALGQRLITATEGGGEWHLHADMIKRVTGSSDEMSARKLYSNVIIQRTPAFLPMIATNSAPTIESADSALWRRLMVLPFDEQVMDNQKIGLDTLMVRDIGCRIAWLSWLVEGYIQYLRHGLGGAPRVASERAFLFRSGVSDFHQFLTDAIIFDETTLGQRISTNMAYRIYEAWCIEHRVQERYRLSKHVFTRKLRSNGFECFKAGPRVGEPLHGEVRTTSWLNHCAFNRETLAELDIVVDQHGQFVSGNGYHDAKISMGSFEGQFSPDGHDEPVSS